MWTYPSVLDHFLVLWQSWVSGLAKLRTKSCTKGTQGGSLGAPQWQLVSLSCIFTLLNLRAVWISCWNVFSLTVFLSHIQTHPSILCNMMLDLEFWIHFFFVSSDQLSHSVMSDSLRPHEPQHASPPYPSPTAYVHWVSDAIQPSHPLSSPSPPALNSSQHQGLFQWVNSSHEVAKGLEFQLQHQSFQWTPRTDLL